jgi:hypothetical protein
VSWLDVVAGRLAAIGVAPEPARQLATVTLSAFEGALLLARVTRSRAPLVAVGQALRAMIASFAPVRDPIATTAAPARGRSRAAAPGAPARR